MAKKDVQTFEYTTSTPDGPKTVYQIKVVDKETGVASDSITTTDFEKADEFYSDAVVDLSSDVTVNGGDAPAISPLSPPTGPDGAFKSFGTGPPKPADIQASSGDPGTSAMQQADLDRPPGYLDSPRNQKFTAKSKKAPVDCSGLPDDQRRICEESVEEKLKRGVSGVFGTKRIQAMVNRIDCESEKVVGHGPDNNAFIVIGNDRPGTKSSGYGGKGHTQCDAIDLVVGLGGFAPEQADMYGSKSYTNPNFLLDSARIYVSQKTDIDKNFEIGTADGVQSKSKAKSAVALKADNIRLVARESLILTTGQDSFNSQGGQIHAWTGIHLMANNNEEDLQPIPVGNNLAKAIYELSAHIESLAKIFHAYLKYQMKYNQAVANHTHMETFYAKKTQKSRALLASGQRVDMEQLAKTELSILKHLTNLAGYRNNYLTAKGSYYINSRFNKVN